MQSCREIFWEVICSDHHTVLVGATVTVWCSESVSQQERRLSLLEVVLALFVVLLRTLGTGKLLRAMEISTFNCIAPAETNSRG